MERRSGILMPIFSLPNKYGIGSFGKEAYKFVDFLQLAGQKIWQILPLVQTGYGNSPYSSVCSYSFSPYYISVESLREQGLITKAEAKFALSDKHCVDYSDIFAVRYPLLRKAFARFDIECKEFKNFLRKKEYYDYALYMAIKYVSGQKHFYEWEEPLRRRDKKALNKFAQSYTEELLFWQFVQYEAKRQWTELKKYANSKGISIIGDMPIYVALDSVDVWKNPQLFKLDENFAPKKVAGVPPDYFCEKGQLWGNPVYDYEIHKKDGFSWWIERIKNTLKIYDYVRIDHFRAFDRYYEINSDAEDATVGEWIEVPSKEFFDSLHNSVDKNRIIAEDLGIIDGGVRELLSYVGYPGMKILSFAFNGEENNLYLPERLPENCICYTGTHDNDTLLGLIAGASDWDRNNLMVGVRNSLKKLKLKKQIDSDKKLVMAITELGLKSKANTFVIPMQDVLLLGSEYRINEPGTVKEQNWAIKFSDSQFKKSTALKLKKLVDKYDR